MIEAARDSKKSIKIFGTDYETPDGTCIRDYIHVNDICNAHILALDRLLAGDKGTECNLGNGRGFSVREIIDSVIKITGSDLDVIHTDRRPGDPPILVADPTKAKRIFNWKPLHSDIDTIVESAWRFHCRND